MASVTDLQCLGPAVFSQAPTDPNAPVRLGDMPMLAALPSIVLAGGVLTGPGITGQYFSDGKVFWYCYLPNRWAWSFLVNNILPPAP